MDEKKSNYPFPYHTSSFLEVLSPQNILMNEVRTVKSIDIKIE